MRQLEEAGRIRNLKERSITCYKNYVSYFLDYVKKDPSGLTCQDVRDFLFAKKDEGLNVITLNLYNSAIRFFYRNVLHILWDDVTVPRVITDHKLPTVLTASEIDRLLDATDNLKYRTMLATMYLPSAPTFRSMSGTPRTAWTVLPSFQKRTWIFLRSTGSKKAG